MPSGVPRSKKIITVNITNMTICKLAENRKIPYYFLHAGSNLAHRMGGLFLGRGSSVEFLEEMTLLEGKKDLVTYYIGKLKENGVVSIKSLFEKTKNELNKILDKYPIHGSILYNRLHKGFFKNNTI